MKYLDPKSDITFKKVFGQHPHLLKSFLNALLPLPEGTCIESLQYLPAELVPEIPLMKNSIVDVRCSDNLGRQFIVEMQLYWTTSFMQRVLFNASKAYVRQLDKTLNYSHLKPVYALSLINDTFEHNKPEFYHHFQIINVDDDSRKIEGLEFVFIELPKFRAQNISEKKLQVLWLRFLTEIDENTRELPEEFADTSEINEALESLKESAFTKSELEHYNKYWDAVRTEKTAHSDYFDKGKEEGFTEGEQIGLQKGEQIGLQKGLFTAIIAYLRSDGTPQQASQIFNQPVETCLMLKNLLDQYGHLAEQHLDKTN